MFPNKTLDFILYIWFVQSSTHVHINWKGGPYTGSTFVSILQLGVQQGALSYWGSAPNKCSKNIDDGPIKVAPSKQKGKKKSWEAHPWIEH